MICWRSFYRWSFFRGETDSWIVGGVLYQLVDMGDWLPVDSLVTPDLCILFPALHDLRVLTRNYRLLIYKCKTCIIKMQLFTFLFLSVFYMKLLALKNREISKMSTLSAEVWSVTMSTNPNDNVTALSLLHLFRSWWEYIRLILN